MNLFYLLNNIDILFFDDYISIVLYDVFINTHRMHFKYS